MTQTEEQELIFKKRKPVWPWILVGIVLIAAVFYFLFSNEGHNRGKSENDQALIEVHENNPSVVSYVNFIDSDTNKMSLDHSYTNMALTELTKAVEAMAMEVDYDVKADISKAKQLADEITKDPLSTDHADKIRNAADILSTALQNMQRSKYPELSAEASQVRNAVSAIAPETLTLNQRDTIKSFFREAAMLLKKMN